MPRRRNAPRRRRPDLAELTRDQEYHLTRGSFFFDGIPDRADFEAAWEEHGERLLAEWVEEHPGTRPFAWWLLDHGEERPVTADGPNAAGWEAAARAEAKRHRFGFLHTDFIPALQEPEEDYLRRLGLLSANEEAALAAGNDD
jgi:hypothetical protein